MGKHGISTAAAEALPPKRQRVEDGDAYIDNHDDDDEEHDDNDSTPAQTPASTADTLLTGATTPRPKFPSDLKTLACTWPGCTKTFNRPARLRDHLNSHTNSRPFKCPHAGCDKDYIEDKHLKQHIKAVHTHDRRYQCTRPGCGKTFVTGTRLRRHQAVHEGADRFRCDECGQRFRKRETLHKHLRKDHLGVPSYECPEPGCHDAFDTKPALKRHQERVHGDIKFWCAECGAVPAADGSFHRVGFTTNLLLQAHLKQEHQNCIFCDYASASRYELQQHIETHHSGKTVDQRRTQACPHQGCPKRFTKKSNLNAHIRTAHQGFRFICGQVPLSGPAFQGWSNEQGCSDAFSTKVRLEDHVRFRHLGHERPRLSRPETQAAIDSVDDLSAIMANMDQRIACPHCSQLFVRSSDLHAHVANHHVGRNAHASASFNAQASVSLAPGLPDILSDVHLDKQPLNQELDMSSWPEETAEDEIFAAQMDYGPCRDEWLEDEANILLLARHLPDEPCAANIDPYLASI